MQVLSAEIGFERGGSGGGKEEEGEAADAAASVAQGQATEATSIGAAIKDFLTTPQVLPCCFNILLCSSWSLFDILIMLCLYIAC